MITVFTPTYNRKKLLARAYDALLIQSCNDFVWLIVDDGSDDGTEELVRSWIAENPPFKIEYAYKKNGGLHTAYNLAIQMAYTELFVCVDSDDYLLETAVADILNFWKLHGGKEYSGIVALNKTPDTNYLGQKLPDVPCAHLIDLRCHYGCTSDLKMIYRTEILNEYGPIPEYKGEHYMNPYYLFLKIDRYYPMLLLNEPICMVNYQVDGMTSSVLRQYVESPNSFAELRRMMMSMPQAPFSYVMRNAIHYVSSMIFARDIHIVRKSPRKVETIFALIPGFVLNILIRVKNRRNARRGM